MDNKVNILGSQFSNFARSVMLCCEEKGIGYDYGYSFNGNNIEFRSKEHLQLNPFGKVPVLLHGDRSIYETTAICRYLDAEFDGPMLQPEDNYSLALVDQWCAIITIYIDRIVVRDYLLEIVFPQGEGKKVRTDQLSKAEPQVIEILTLLEKQIGRSSFICGNRYTIADALLSPILHYLKTLPYSSEIFELPTNVDNYIERMQQRSSGKAILIPPSFN